MRDIDTFLKQYGFIRTDTQYWDDTYSWGDAFYIKKELVSFRRYLFSILKNFLYSFNFSYKFLIYLRNIIWKIRKNNE